jgi:histidyl-tRNA synthetase
MADDTTPQEEEEKKPQKLQTPPGVHDILPKDHEYHTFIKKVVRHRARQAGFKRITTPIMEFTEVFTRGVGEGTDIVEKQMYTFDDQSGRSLTLKPEGTAGVVRAYVQHGMKDLPQPVELYYIEPHFRYDRPQKGRYRLFWQLGFEIIGELDPALDAQCIHIATKIFSDLGLKNQFDLQINNIGTKASRAKYIDALRDYFIGKERALNDEDRAKIDTNPLRLLDSKDEDTQILVDMAPKFADFRTKEDIAYHKMMKECLDELGITYTENHKLVRGMDYYSQTVWEFWDKEKGSDNAVGAGGRYDGLVELMGGEPTPGVGFACGMERLILHMKRNNILAPSKDGVHIFVAQLGDLAKKKSLPIIDKLRDAGVKTVGALGKGSMKAQLALADKFKVPFTLIMGSTEVREGTIILRSMEKGQQRHINVADVVKEVVAVIGEENLDNYSPGEVYMGDVQ